MADTGGGKEGPSAFVKSGVYSVYDLPFTAPLYLASNLKGDRIYFD